MHKQPHAHFIAKIGAVEDVDADVDEEKLSDLFRCPENIGSPNFMRWGSTYSVAKILVDNFIEIRCLARGSKQCCKAGSMMYIYSDELLKLMDTRNVPTTFSSTDSSADGTSVAADDSDLKPGDTPVFLVALCFFCAFCETFFNDEFEWAKRNDPVLGIDSYGQRARHCPERVWYQHARLLFIKENYEVMPEFQNFMEARKGLAALGDPALGGKEHYDVVPAFFFRQYEFIQDKHLTTYWRSSMALPCMLGGQPVLARAFALWLLENDDGSGGDSNDDGDGDEDEYNDAEEEPGTIFPTMEITLEHHEVSHGESKGCLQKIMLYLISEGDRDTILQLPWIDKHLDLIRELAYAKVPVDLLILYCWPDSVTKWHPGNGTRTRRPCRYIS